MRRPRSDLLADLERLRRMIDELEVEAEREGMHADVVGLRRALARIEGLLGLQDSALSVHNVGVTQAQKDRRGAGVAKARAKGPIATAIANSKWRSVTRYARARARVSQPALSRYITGSLECPPEVADRVHEDFPHLTDADWPKPPRRH